MLRTLILAFAAGGLLLATLGVGAIVAWLVRRPTDTGDQPFDANS